MSSDNTNSLTDSGMPDDAMAPSVQRISFLSRQAFVRWAIVAILVTQLICLATHAIRSAPTNDEFGHFYAGMRYWEVGDTRTFNVNPPLVRMIAAIPAVIAWQHSAAIIPAGAQLRQNRTEMIAGRSLYSQSPAEFHFYLVLGRLLVSLFALLGTVVIFAWGRQMIGDVGAIVAASFWALQPQIVSHGSLITNDVPVAVCMTLAAWAFCRWCGSPTMVRALLGGMALGLATLCKFTALLLWPLFLLFTIEAVWRTRSLNVVGQATVAIAVALFVVAIPYRFEGIGQLLETMDLVTDYRPLSQLEDPQWRNRLADHWFGRVPSPFPAEFVVGIDQQQKDFVNGLPSYAAGQRSMHGWWWFYLFSMLVKVPTGTWLAIVAALVYWVGWQPRLTRDRLMTMMIGIAIIDITAMKSGFAQQHRYILPLYPFLFLWLATPLEDCWTNRVLSRGKAVIQSATMTGLMLTAIGFGWAAPDWLGAFNLLAGGTDRGHLRMFNDATDWGQDTFRVVDWIKRHPECYPIELESANGFNHIDPLALGVPASALVAQGQRPKCYVISKSDLVAVWRLDPFLSQTPVDRIATTHFVYENIDAEE